MPYCTGFSLLTSCGVGDSYRGAEAARGRDTDRPPLGIRRGNDGAIGARADVHERRRNCLHHLSDIPLALIGCEAVGRLFRSSL